MPASVAEIDLDAVRHNVRSMASFAGDATVCAVVKADGYGHGAAPVAEAALGSGAAWLAVAHVAEASRLRAAGIESPILLLSEPRPDEIDAAIAAGVRLTVFRADTVVAVSDRARALGVPPVPVHLKIDTGMRRIGCEPTEAVAMARRIADATGVRHEGTMTHLALADEPDDPTTDAQLDIFDRAIDELTAAGLKPGIRHAANSAGTIGFPRARLDLVRVGIALYGIPPSPALAGAADLRPALRWTSSISMVKVVSAGDHVSYGHRHRFDRETTIATIPVGYADGLRRRLGLAGGAVLIRGRRCPMVGVVTMDQFVVDCGPGADVMVGDEVVLVGTQDSDEISASEMASAVDTIGYEVVCAISARVPRVHR